MSIADKITYGYMKNIKHCMECPVCHDKMTFKKNTKAWVCDDCGYSLLEQEFLDDFVFWFCYGCGEYLNTQDGFKRKGTSWMCTKCGFDNDTTFSNIKGECKDCGKLLDNPNATICSGCETILMIKAKQALDTDSEIYYTLSDALKEDKRNEGGDYYE